MNDIEKDVVKESIKELMHIINDCTVLKDDTKTGKSIKDIETRLQTVTNKLIDVL